MNTENRDDPLYPEIESPPEYATLIAAWRENASLRAHLAQLQQEKAQAERSLAEEKHAHRCTLESRDGLFKDLQAAEAALVQCQQERDVLQAEVNERRFLFRAETAEQELAGIDAVMARRPALDLPTRRENIEKAINYANRADEAERKLKASEQDRARLRGIETRCRALQELFSANEHPDREYQAALVWAASKLAEALVGEPPPSPTIAEVSGILDHDQVQKIRALRDEGEPPPPEPQKETP